MCLDENNKLMVFLGTGNEELKSQSLDGHSWTKSDIGISCRTISQCPQQDSKTFVWSGGCSGGIVTDSAIYIIENVSNFCCYLIFCMVDCLNCSPLHHH